MACVIYMMAHIHWRKPIVRRHAIAAICFDAFLTVPTAFQNAMWMLRLVISLA
jgi:hypothetical protein